MSGKQMNGNHLLIKKFFFTDYMMPVSQALSKYNVNKVFHYIASNS